MAYDGDLLGGALLLWETKEIASLLIKNPTKEEFKRAVEVDNILQKRSISSAKRNAGAARKRLELLGKDFIEALVSADTELSTQICMAGTIKRNKLLLGDFMLNVMSDYYILHKIKIKKYTWETYVKELQSDYPEDLNFSQASLTKMRNVVFNILSQAGYIDNPRNGTLQKVFVREELKDLLHKNQEKYVLKCMEVAK